MATKEVKPADQWVDPATGEYRVIAPGQTFRSITEKIARIVLTPHTPMGWFALFTVAGRRRHDAAGGAYLAVPQGRRHLGHHAARGLGIRDHQLRLVDRYRPRRHADLGHSAALQAGLAQRHQPLCRGHDDLCRHVRRHVPADSRRPSLAGLLAVAAALHHDGVAAVPLAAACGTCSRSRLTPRFRWSSGTSAWCPISAPSATARSRRSASIFTACSRVGWRGSVRHWMRYETASLLLAGLATPLVLSRAHGHQLRFRGGGSARLAHHHLPALLSSPALFTPALPWCSRWPFRCASSITWRRW